MPTTTTLFSSQISRCRHCGERIGWLTSKRGGLYPVNLINDGSTGGRAVTNDFHGCPRQEPPRMPRQEEIWTPPPVPVPAAALSSTSDFVTRTVQSRGISTPPSLETVASIRKTVEHAMSVYAVAYARYMVEGQGHSPQAAGSNYWSQMKSLVNAQIDGILSGYAVINGTPAPARPVADNELDPPADPSQWTVPSVPATASLDAVVAATEKPVCSHGVTYAESCHQGDCFRDGQIDDQLSPDYAGGPEPVPAGWPSDDDVPF